MNLEASLDKIIGFSPITSSNFTMHHEDNVLAFSSGGFVSIVVVEKRQRIDFSIPNNSHDINALAFAPKDRVLAIGTAGPDAKIFILSFSSNYEQIENKIELKTKENGFSCIAINTESSCRKLVSVGSDPKPYILLWDLSLSQPEPIGYYHLPVIPRHISISPTGQIAIVSGPKLLKLIDISFTQTPNSQPVLLKTRNLMVTKYKDSTFVAAYQSSNPRQIIYALTEDGSLLSYDKSYIVFTKEKKSISCSRIILDCGPTPSMAVDGKLVLVGNQAGTMIAVKCDSNTHSIIGKFSADGRPLLAVASSVRIVAGAYDNGFIIVYPRKPNKPPTMTLASHRGPVCSFCVSKEDDEKYVFSTGSDGTIRKWEVIKHQSLVSGSSQSQVAVRKLTRIQENFMTSLTGVRCCATSGNYVFAGDSAGFLYMLDASTLKEIKSVNEHSRGTIAMAMNKEGTLFATGGCDGMIRVYSFKDGALNNYITDPTHTAPVTSIVITNKYVVSSSKEGIRFANLPLAEPEHSVPVKHLILKLALLPNEEYVVSCDMSGYLMIWDIKHGTVFRKYQISTYLSITALSVDPSGLFITAGLSDSTVHLIDVFSGDDLLSFKTPAGMLIDIQWHLNDLLISSMSGCILRWTMPEKIYQMINEKVRIHNFPLDFLLEEEKKEEPQSILLSGNKVNRLLSTSTIKSYEMKPDWTFREVQEGDIQEGKEEEEAEQAEEDNTQEQEYNAARPSIQGDMSNADNIIRASYARPGKSDDTEEEEEEEQMPSITPEKESKIEPSSIIQPLDDSDKEKFDLDLNFSKDSPPSSPKRSPESTTNEEQKKTTEQETEIEASQISRPSINESTIKKEKFENEPPKVESPIKPSNDETFPEQRITVSLRKTEQSQLQSHSPSNVSITIKQILPSQNSTIHPADSMHLDKTNQQTEIHKVSQQLNELIQQAEELLSIEPINEGEAESLEYLKQVVAEFCEDDIREYFSKLFTSN